MSLGSLPPLRSRFWRNAGWTMLAGTLGVTAYLVLRGPNHRTLVTRGSTEGFAVGQRGSYGTLTEQLGRARFDLKYARIEGRSTDLHLSGVEGRLAEPEAAWVLESPAAHRAQEGLWDLMAPVRIVGRDAEGVELGRGLAGGAGVAIRWEKGVWVGLVPLRWESLAGQGRGVWTLPVGWRRAADGVLTVAEGPVVWESSEAQALQRMTARSLELSPRFVEGRLTEVEATLAEGTVHAARASFDPEAVRWFPPVRFQARDGWNGEAEAGFAPRPKPGDPLQSMEFKGFRGERTVTGGRERAQALGARWTPAGLRLEGSVRWEQPVDGQRLTLEAPRVLLRDRPGGTDLPADLPAQWARAEGLAILRWGGRSLSGPRMEVNRITRAWRIQAPVQGRAEEGTFSAGEGRGGPSSWTFDGPVVASLADGGQLRGQSLVWTGAQWTLAGRPATWSRQRERLSGRRLVRKGDQMLFPEGLSGALAAPEGDLTLHADRGERSADRLLVEGQVEVQGRGWTLKADRVVVALAPGRVVREVQARGRVSLEGQLGQGTGQALDLDPARRRAVWSGRVHGSGTAKPW